MNYKKCKECVLHGCKIHNCKYCYVDLHDEQHIKEILQRSSKLTANIVCQINKRQKECSFFRKEFSVSGNTKNVKRQRLWKNENNSIVPQSKEATIKGLLKNIEKSRKRSLANFINYGCNGTWNYFCTLTFDPKKISRTNQVSIKYAWKLFRQKMQYKFPDIQLLFVIEYHADDKALHFHGVIGNADLSAYLDCAVDQAPYYEIKNKYGSIIAKKFNAHYLKNIQTLLKDDIYNFKPSFYPYGFNSIIPLKDKTGDLSVHDKIIFYLNKYMSKDKSAIMYNGKRYFRTHNLEEGIKVVGCLGDPDIDAILANCELTIKKETEKSTICYIT